MEAILVDVKRVMRSLLGMVRAVSGAFRNTSVDLDAVGRRGRAAGSAGAKLADMYGRRGRADIYSSKETFELYRKMSFDKNPPL